MGSLLTDYHGIEEATFHLFPPIPWLMPVTIGGVLATLIAFGLRPTHFLKLLFHIIFMALVSTFTVIGLYYLISEDNVIVITIKLDQIQEMPLGVIYFQQSFIFLGNERRHIDKLNSTGFLICLIIITTLSRFNEKIGCDSIISCMKTQHSWLEPIMLSLMITSLGLYLPEMFITAQHFLSQSRHFKIKTRMSSTVITGCLCTGLVYLFTSNTLIIISGSSLLAKLTLEKLYLLLYLSNEVTDEMKDFTSTGDSDTDDTDQIDSQSDTESNYSDISTIVAEYKAQIKIVSGNDDTQERAIRRMLFLSRGLIMTTTVFAIFLDFSFSNKELSTTLVISSGLIILILLNLWVTNRYEDNCENLTINGPKEILSYLLNLLVLSEVSSIIWIYLTTWIIIGLITNMIHKQRYSVKVHVYEKHFLAIKESPPIFETICEQK